MARKQPGEGQAFDRQPTTHSEAASRLVDMAVVKSIAYRNREVAENTEGCDSDLVGFAVAFVSALKARGYPFFVHCYLRGADEQNRLFREGRSRARFGQSPHNYGMAADIVHFGRYWNLTEKEWAVVGLIGKEIARKRNLKITWGGDWRFYDPAHWELADWKLRSAMGA